MSLIIEAMQRVNHTSVHQKYRLQKQHCCSNEVGRSKGKLPYKNRIEKSYQRQRQKQKQKGMLKLCIRSDLSTNDSEESRYGAHKGFQSQQIFTS